MVVNRGLGNLVMGSDQDTLMVDEVLGTTQVAGRAACTVPSGKTSFPSPKNLKD